jgi:hypothetical protein
MARYLVIFSLVISGLAVLRAQDTRALVEYNRIVTVEIESAPLADGWLKAASVAGFSGSGYYTWNKGTPTSITSAGQGVLTYKIKINNPGTYNFRWHNYHNYPADQTLENDSWLKVDNGNWVKCFQSGGGSWNWNCRLEPTHGVFEDPQYTLSAGYHTVQVSGRSYRHCIDRFHLYQTGIYSPFNLAHPLSPREGDPIPDSLKVKILEPVAGTALVPGEIYTFKGQGTVVFWKHDVGDDGFGIASAGNRNERDILIPAHADSSDKIAVMLSGTYGTDKIVYPISQAGIADGLKKGRINTSVIPGQYPKVRLHLGQKDRVVISLHAADGRLIARLGGSVLPAGDHVYPCTGIPNGMYFYHIRTGKCGSLTGKLAVTY